MKYRLLRAALFSLCMSAQGACSLTPINGELMDTSLLLSLSNLPANLQYDGNTHALINGFANGDITPAYSGHIERFTANNSLPDGVTLNAVTGVISGTPVWAFAATNYVLTAGSSFGAASRTISLSAWRSLQEGVGAADTRGQGIAVDSAGNIIVSGRTNGALHGQTNTGQDTAVIKYDRHGTRLWTRLVGGSGTPHGYSVTTDSADNIIVAGETTSGFAGAGAIGTNDGYVLKLDANGNTLWSRVLGVGGGTTALYSVVVDAADQITAVGRTDGNLDSQTKTGTEDLVLVRYDGNGNKLFTLLFGGAAALTNGFDLAADASGNLYAVGITNGNLHGQTLAGTQDMALLKFDSAGNRLWTRLLGAGGVLSFGDGVDTDTAGNVYICGDATGSIDGQTFNGSADAVIARFDADGNKQWTRMFGASAQVTKAKDLHVDASGNVYAAGYTNGTLDGIAPVGSRDMALVKYDTNGNKQWTRLAGAPGANQTEGTWITADGRGLLVPGHTFGGFDGNSPTGSPDLVLYRTPF